MKRFDTETRLTGFDKYGFMSRPKDNGHNRITLRMNSNRGQHNTVLIQLDTKRYTADEVVQLVEAEVIVMRSFRIGKTKRGDIIISCRDFYAGCGVEDVQELEVMVFNEKNTNMTSQYVDIHSPTFQITSSGSRTGMHWDIVVLFIREPLEEQTPIRVTTRKTTGRGNIYIEKEEL